jgi:hypothetical protein
MIIYIPNLSIAYAQKSPLYSYNNSTVHFLQYKNTYLGIEIQYPNSWKIETRKDEAQASKFNDYLPTIMNMIDSVKISSILPYESKDSSGFFSKYSPQVNVTIFPESPISDQKVEINATFSDMFGKIQDAILSYSIDNGTSWNSTEMDLIWGTHSNGTYLGKIPAQIENTTVKYNLYFKDDINYTYTSNHEYIVRRDIVGPTIFDHIDNYTLVPEKHNPFTIQAKDSGSGVKNVTFYYSTDINSRNFSSLNMTLIKGNKWNGIYEGILPPFKTNTNITYYVESYDYAKNLDDFNSIKRILLETPFWTINPHDVNDFGFELDLLEVDNINLSAMIDIGFIASMNETMEIPEMLRGFNREKDLYPSTETFVIDLNSSTNIIPGLNMSFIRMTRME